MPVCIAVDENGDQKFSVEPPCLKCPYGPSRKDGLDAYCIPPSGSDDPVLYFVGEAPGRVEAEKREFFVGKTGAFLKKLLYYARQVLSREDYVPDYKNAALTAEYFYRGQSFTKINEVLKKKYRFNNSVRSFPPKGRKPSPKPLKLCYDLLMEDIFRVRPSVIVAVGSVAVNRFFESSVRIMDVHGSFLPVRLRYNGMSHDCYIVPIEHPSSAFRRSNDSISELAAYGRDVVGILKKAIQRSMAIREGRDRPEPIEEEFLKNIVRIVKNDDPLPHEFVSFVDDILSEKKPYAIDLETNSLSPWKRSDPKILCFAISSEGETWSVSLPDDPVSERWSILNRLVRSDAPLIAHNATFEVKWLWHFLNGPFEIDVHDTMVMSWVVDQRKTHSLNACMVRRYGLDLKSLTEVTYDTIEKVDEDTLLLYCGLDATAAFMLFRDIHKELVSENLYDAYLHVRKRIQVISWMETVGIGVDFGRVSEVRKMIEDEMNKIEDEIRKIPSVVSFERSKNKEFNLRSSVQVAEYLFDYERVHAPERSTRDEILAELDHPFAKLLRRYRTLSKLVSSYVDKVDGFGASYVDVDGRVRANLLPTGTRTGRLSARDPNLQQLPKRKEGSSIIRSFFVPREGNVFVSMDYSAMEVRGIATLSGDPFLIEQVKSGDVHGFWTQKIVDASPKIFHQLMPDEWERIPEDKPAFKKARSFVKNTLVFPLFYGCTKNKVRRLFRLHERSSENDLLMDVVDDFWRTYEHVAEWHNRLRMEYAHNNCIRGINGLVYRGPLSPNAVFNYPVQGLCADVCIDAMSRLWKFAVNSGRHELAPILQIHDELVFELPEDGWKACVDDILPFMLTWSLKGFLVPIEVEVNVGGDFEHLSTEVVKRSDEAFPNMEGMYVEQVEGYVPGKEVS